jgi:glycine/D-amino acid oxidase-like deaminating enzyme
LRRRAAAAEEQSVTARLVDTEATLDLAPQLVDPTRCAGGVFYPRDGTARSSVITAALRDQATANGARLVYDTAVSGIDLQAGRVQAVHTTVERLAADDVVLACGIWGPAVAALAGVSLPLVPVGHPYVYGPVHEAAAAATPFVRWPEHHIYARDHGDRVGLGSYDHAPLPIDIASLGASAEQHWPGQVFDAAVDRALALLPAGQRFVPVERLNGVFAMTADNLPLLGGLGDVIGLWAAEALWVTHAAAATRSLAELITGKTPTIDGLDALRPDRLADRPADELTTAALRLYHDIYATA